MHATPAVARDGSVVFATLGGSILRVDSTGRILWRRRLEAPVFSSPALAGQRVLVGTDADLMWCLDLDSGRTLWRYRLGPCLSVAGAGPESVRCDADGSPAVVGDTVYFTGDALYAVALASGKLRLRFPLQGHAFSSPAVGDDTIYFGTQAPTGRVHLPASNGKQRDQAGSTGGGGSGDQPQATAGHPNAIHAVDVKGRLRWVFRARWDCDSTPALGRDALYVGCDDRFLYSIAPSDGRLRWKVGTGGAIRSSPAVALDGTVYVGSFDHKLYAVKPDGQVAWTFSTGGPIHSSPAVDPSGILLVGSRDQHLYAIDSHGQLLWRLRLGGDVDASPVVGSRQRIYVGADDGLLYALEP